MSAGRQCTEAHWQVIRRRSPPQAWPVQAPPRPAAPAWGGGHDGHGPPRPPCRLWRPWRLPFLQSGAAGAVGGLCRAGGGHGAALTARERGKGVVETSPRLGGGEHVQSPHFVGVGLGNVSWHVALAFQVALVAGDGQGDGGPHHLA